MTYKVGPKGQVVVAKEARDRLGVRPGWLAIQMVVGDHVELHFVPPASSASLKGCLAKHTKVRIGPGSDGWTKARSEAWGRAARRKIRG